MHQSLQPISNEKYIEKINSRLQLLMDFTQSLHNDKIQMPGWKTFTEIVILKLCFHISSMFQLFKGTPLPFRFDDKNPVIFDEPSIYVMFRTITENYLTFYYLFAEPISDEEKKFRFIVYEYCGIKQRQSFFAKKPEHIEKKAQEQQHLKKLQIAIEKSNFFAGLNPKTKTKIIDGVQPRLKSWSKLINDAGLFLFNSNLYGFKSGYSHSEFISLLQIKSDNYGFESNSRKEHFVLLLTEMLICRTIDNLTSIFPSIKEYHDNLDPQVKIEMQSLANALKLNFDEIPDI